jgi:hypothetical protein
MKSKQLVVWLGLGVSVLAACGGASQDDVATGDQHLETGDPAADTSKATDDRCFAAYSRAAGQCNKSAGDDEAAFTACLTPVKANLVTCCKGGGSTSCASDAARSGDAEKAVDDECFVAYSQAAGHCNESAAGDESAFAACLAPAKADLTECCKNGGSASCDADAPASR